MKMKKHLIMGFLIVFSVLFAQPIVFAEQQMTRNNCVQSLTPTTNIKDSLVLSAMTACIPGVLEKVEEYKQIKCEEVVCSYNALKNGLDPTFCEKRASYQTCRYITGEAFALPFANFAEKIRDSISQYLANPYSLAVVVARKAASQCSGGCDSVVWAGTSLFLAVNDLASFAQRIQQIFEYGLDMDRNGKDYCEELPDIKEEVDSILEATNSNN